MARSKGVRNVWLPELNQEGAGRMPDGNRVPAELARDFGARDCLMRERTREERRIWT